MKGNEPGLEIQQRYESTLEKIEAAARSSGRSPAEVHLVVVTKMHPVESIRAVVAAGASVLGENYADEALPKIEALRDYPGLQWHMIGHVQRRKAGIVVEQFSYLHSLDSLKLAERLNRLAGETGRRFSVLLECNVSGEANKTGFAAWDERAWPSLVAEIEPVLALPHLEIRGTMTMAPFFDLPEPARPYFRKLRQLQSFLSSQFPGTCWDELSMGMSGDFEVAIQEGATWVRIGTHIMGSRHNLGGD